MGCRTRFRILLFIVTYATCIIHVSCNNESSSTEIHDSSDGKITTHYSNSNNSLGLDNKLINVSVSETQSSNVSPGYMEGGSTDKLNSKKKDLTATTRQYIQSKSLNEKSLQSETDQYNLGDASPSTDRNHRTQGRKGVVEEPNSEESTTERTIESAKSGKEENSSVRSMNNVTNVTTSFPVASVVPNYTTNSSSTTIPGSNISVEHTTQLGTTGINMTVNSSSTTVDSTSGKVLEGIVNNKSKVSEVSLSPKQKPEYTRDDSDVEDHSSYTLTSAESDYVIPIVATIFAAPLLIVLAMFLYKRSKEFWERRHYRRMDFLIDGMYND